MNNTTVAEADRPKSYAFWNRLRSLFSWLSKGPSKSGPETKKEHSEGSSDYLSSHSPAPLEISSQPELISESPTREYQYTASPTVTCSTSSRSSTLFSIPTPNTPSRPRHGWSYPSPIREESMQTLDLACQLTLANPFPMFEGTYSDVYKGSYRGQEIAIKSIRAVKDAEGMRIKIQSHVDMLWQLRHRNVLTCYGYAGTKGIGDYGEIVYPWRGNGDSRRTLSTKPPPLRRTRMFLDVASAIQYLHNRQFPVVHGDLKPSNILMTDDGTAELCDSGLLPLIRQDDFVGEKTISTSFTNTARYMAPELIQGEQSSSLASDIYALGCIGYEFLYLRPPYANITNEEAKAIYKIYRQIGKGTPPAPRPSNLNKDLSGLWDILEACWREQPERRPTATIVVEYLEEHSQSIADSFSQVL